MLHGFTDNSGLMFTGMRPTCPRLNARICLKGESKPPLSQMMIVVSRANQSLSLNVHDNSASRAIGSLGDGAVRDIIRSVECCNSNVFLTFAFCNISEIKLALLDAACRRSPCLLGFSVIGSASRPDYFYENPSPLEGIIAVPPTENPMLQSETAPTSPSGSIPSSASSLHRRSSPSSTLAPSSSRKSRASLKPSGGGEAPEFELSFLSLVDPEQQIPEVQAIVDEINSSIALLKAAKRIPVQSRALNDAYSDILSHNLQRFIREIGGDEQQGEEHPKPLLDELLGRLKEIEACQERLKECERRLVQSNGGETGPFLTINEEQTNLASEREKLRVDLIELIEPVSRFQSAIERSLVPWYGIDDTCSDGDEDVALQSEPKVIETALSASMENVEGDLYARRETREARKVERRWAQRVRTVKAALLLLLVVAIVLASSSLRTLNLLPEWVLVVAVTVCLTIASTAIWLEATKFSSPSATLEDGGADLKAITLLEDRIRSLMKETLTRQPARWSFTYRRQLKELMASLEAYDHFVFAFVESRLARDIKAGKKTLRNRPDAQRLLRGIEAEIEQTIPSGTLWRHRQLRQAWLRIQTIRAEELPKLKKRFEDLQDKIVETRYIARKEPDMVEKDRLSEKVKRYCAEANDLMRMRDSLDREVRSLSCEAMMPKPENGHPDNDADDEFSSSGLVCAFPDLYHLVTLYWTMNDKPDDNRSNSSASVIPAIDRVKAILLKFGLSLPYDSSALELGNLPEALVAKLPRNVGVRGGLLRNEDWKLLKTTQLPSNGADAEKEIAGLRKSLLLSRKVPHRSILPCEGAMVVSPTEIWLQFEFMRGGDLSVWCKERPRNSAVKLNVLAQIADAVVTLHDNGIVHRDIKPQNIVMDSNDDSAVPKLTDFELGKDLAHPTTRRSVGGVGTRNFMAPELLNDPDLTVPAYRKCDVYSTAATILYVLEFDADDSKAIDSVRKHESSRSFEQQRGGPNLPLALFNIHREKITHSNLGFIDAEKFVGVIARALSSSADERPSSRELARILEHRVCCIASECTLKDSRFDSGGVVCPRGKHYVCQPDFEGLVRYETQTPIGDREALKGEIACPDCGPKEPTFPYDILVRHLRPDVLKLYHLSKDQLKDRDHARELDQKVKAKEEEVLRKKHDEVLVAIHRTHIEQRILSNTCPNIACGATWHEFDGCCAVKCGSCIYTFCGLCGSFGSTSSREAHMHVASCKWNPDRPSFHCPEPVLKRVHRDRRRQALNRYLEAMDPTIREKVRNDPSVSAVMREYKVE